MGNTNPKKLIAIFLALSVGGASGIFAISSVFTKDNSVPTAEERGLLASLPKKNGSAQAFAPATILDHSLSGNVTRLFAREVAEELVSSNPEGPLQINGELTVANPENLENLAREFVLKNIPDPAGELRRPIDLSKIKVLNKFSNKDVNDYFLQVQNAFIRNDPEKLYKALISSTDDNSKFIAISFSLKKQREELYQIPVPAPLLGYHESVIGLSQPLLVFSEAASNDPVRAVAFGDHINNAISGSIDDFEKELESLLSIDPIKLFGAIDNSFVYELFGLQKANAVGFTVIDVVHVPLQKAKWIKELIDLAIKTFVETFKQTLIKSLIDQTVKWVLDGRGGAGPAFVTNWENFFRRAFDNAAGRIIEAISPALCEPFRSIVPGLLSPTPPSGGHTLFRAECTLTDVIENVDDFINGFENGGWVAYYAILEPQNNLTGVLLTLHDAALKEALAASGAAKSQATAGSGFIGSLICDDGESPSRGFLCSDGSLPRITTPGKQFSDALSQAIGATPAERIANVRELAGALGSMLAQMFASELFSSGSRGLYGGGEGVFAEQDIGKDDFENCNDDDPFGRFPCDPYDYDPDNPSGNTPQDGGTGRIVCRPIEDGGFECETLPVPPGGGGGKDSGNKSGDNNTGPDK